MSKRTGLLDWLSGIVENGMRRMDSILGRRPSSRGALLPVRVPVEVRGKRKL